MRTTIIAVVVTTAAVGGGSATAAALITGKQVKDSSLTGKDIRNKSLTKADFRGSVRGPRGSQGPAGPAGPAGPPGPVALSRLTRVEAVLNVAPGDVDAVTAYCPTGQGVVTGGFVAISADGEVFINDNYGSSAGWSVGLDNFDSSVSGELRAYAFCAASGQAVAARRARRNRLASVVGRDVEARRALHR